MSGRFRRRYGSSRARYARARYSGRRFGTSARRARGNMRAANQQNDISNVTINLMKKVKTGVTGFFTGQYDNVNHVFNNKKVYEIGTCALNIFELLRKSEFYQSYSNMYDQFRINRIQVKVTPVTWQTYNQFNLPNNAGNPAFPSNPDDVNDQHYYGGAADNYSQQTNNYIVPQALTIVTAWDRTGLDDTQLSIVGEDNDEIPNGFPGTHYFTTIGDKITTYSSAKSSQLVAGANFNCVRYLYPSSQQEKSLYFSTSELVEQVGEPSNDDPYWAIKKGHDFNYNKITNIHSDPNCPFKPTFLIGVLKVDDLVPDLTVTQGNEPSFKDVNKTKGQIYPVTFNLEFDIGVTFRGLRKTQVV